jgi:hypothetical protein
VSYSSTTQNPKTYANKDISQKSKLFKLTNATVFHRYSSPPAYPQGSKPAAGANLTPPGVPHRIVQRWKKKPHECGFWVLFDYSITKPFISA